MENSLLRFKKRRPVSKMREELTVEAPEDMTAEQVERAMKGFMPYGGTTPTKAGKPVDGRQTWTMEAYLD